MRLIVVAGFLGSGKTSLILGLGRALAARQQSVAIIENEINTSGVDGQVLERSGLVVRQLSAGCVCCTLRTDLETTLRMLHAERHPDVVIIEPSGVAGPALVVEAVAGAVPGLENPQVVGLVDVTRFDLLMQINPLLIENVLAASQVVVINKCDAVEATAVIACRTSLAALDARPALLPLSCRQEADPGLVLDLLDGLRGSPAARSPSHGHTLHAATVARRREISWEAPLGESVLRQRLGNVLTTISAGLLRPQHGVAGHLKLFADAGAAGWLAGSLTGLRQGVAWRGDLQGEVRSLRLTLNAIVADMRQDHLEALVDGALHFKEAE